MEQSWMRFMFNDLKVKQYAPVLLISFEYWPALEILLLITATDFSTKKELKKSVCVCNE
jgi:hypothetical protein